MHVTSAGQFGAAVRSERTRLGFTQEALAAAAGVGARFVVELEAGKPTAQLEKALSVARAVGLVVEVSARD